MTKCIFCGSLNTQRASDLFERGTHNTESNSVGFASIGGHLAIGTSNTKGVSTSLIASKNAPPKQKGRYAGMGTFFLSWIVLATLGSMLGMEADVAIFVGMAIGLALGLRVGMKAREEGRENYSSAMDSFRSRWYCSDCGTAFQPEA